ncbi:Crp/Fnr family transcriptional regulator [Sulfitobacter porphyrae]|uniref:Crp/Fnr family transcriptional regulator n=1 Tax=Sulfitobacter porphyrae TaxID=1246864 RepID=A0ABW2B4F8_9RHOB|nr:cAMP-binding protein [Sulfitobacter porphyrae]
MKLSDYVAAHGRPCTYEAGEYLFRQGEQDGSIYSLQSGLLKAYYLSEDGKEHIKSFILPGGKIGSLASSYQGEACTFSLVCLKPSALVGVNFSDLNEASRSDPELSGEIVDFLLSFGIRKEMREYELLCLSAEDRYKRLLEHTPDLFDLVTQNEIARYLGVTPVGLSRIKNRIS